MPILSPIFGIKGYNCRGRFGNSIEITRGLPIFLSSSITLKLACHSNYIACPYLSSTNFISISYPFYFILLYACFHFHLFLFVFPFLFSRELNLTFLNASFLALTSSCIHSCDSFVEMLAVSHLGMIFFFKLLWSLSLSGMGPTFFFIILHQ